MKGLASFFILLWCVITVIPLPFMVVDMVANGKDSITHDLLRASFELYT